MKISPILKKKKRPILIAGPCSAESEEQVMATAKALAKQNIDLFRAGIWKPRTSPGTFEGVGAIGLKWLQKVKKKTGLKVTTEVANARHVIDALKADVDVLWIGARTTVSPFAVQEIADVLLGVDIPVMIKNPINPDLKLWIGAVERIHKAGISRIAVVHRGFSYFGDMKYRNAPRWQIPIEFKRQFPDIQIIADNSHIAGNTEYLSEIAQRAMDLNFDGLMTEVHPNPEKAYSDAKQQITPKEYKSLIKHLVVRKLDANNGGTLEQYRHQIDEIDDELFHLLGKRVKISEDIGHYKLNHDISILQPTRWNEILQKGYAKGEKLGLTREFISAMLMAIHQESINHQANIMNERKEGMG